MKVNGNSCFNGLAMIVPLLSHFPNTAIHTFNDGIYISDFKKIFAVLSEDQRHELTKLGWRPGKRYTSSGLKRPEDSWYLPAK